MPRGTRFALLFLSVSIPLLAVLTTALVFLTKGDAPPQAKETATVAPRETAEPGNAPEKPQPVETRPQPTLIDLDLEDVDVTLRRVQSLLGQLHQAREDEARYRGLLGQFETDASCYVGREARWRLPIIVAGEDRVILEDRYPKVMLGRLWSGLFVSTSPQARAALPPGLRVPVSMPLRLRRGELCGIRATISGVTLGGADGLAAHVHVVIQNVRVDP